MPDALFADPIRQLRHLTRFFTLKLVHPAEFRLRFEVIHERSHRAARTELDSFVVFVDTNCVARRPVINLAGMNRLFTTVCVGHVDRTLEYGAPVRALAQVLR